MEKKDIDFQVKVSFIALIGICVIAVFGILFFLTLLTIKY